MQYILLNEKSFNANLEFMLFTWAYKNFYNPAKITFGTNPIMDILTYYPTSKHTVGSIFSKKKISPLKTHTTAMTIAARKLTT